MLSGKVESVVFIEHLGEKLDHCKIRIDFDEKVVFGYYNDLVELIGHYVQYDLRWDLVNGVRTEVIANLVNQHTVQTLDKVEGVRLIPKDTEKRAVCTCDISNLKYGDKEYGVIALMTGIRQGHSVKAQWVECTMVDRNSQTFELRIFTKYTEGPADPYKTLESFVGSYVQFDISSTPYGFQTNSIEYVNMPVVTAPEVDIAYNVLSKVASEDTELNSYVQMFDMLNVIKGQMSGDIGYELVYMAAELNMIDCLQNISDAYEYQALRRAVFVTRGHMLQCNTKFSKPILNFNKLVRTDLKTDKELLLIIDPMAEQEMSRTKKLYYFIREFVKKVIDERRGLDETLSDIVVGDLHAKFGGLL